MIYMRVMGVPYIVGKLWKRAIIKLKIVPQSEVYRISYKHPTWQEF
jgi:hypothetical protein